jgi:hypothetical protein
LAVLLKTDEGLKNSPDKRGLDEDLVEKDHSLRNGTRKNAMLK